MSLILITRRDEDWARNGVAGPHITARMGARDTTRTLLSADAPPPRSKTQAYYAIHPTWQDIVPIPQADAMVPGQLDPGPALATIAYTPRYAEAMSYLRAVMAKNEVSERALALTEDLIGMNPAHYTVWIYRMSVLKGLWGQGTGIIGDDSKPAPRSSVTDVLDDEQLWKKIELEITWLNEIAIRNLKNYQIWHHRHALVDLLPSDPKPNDTHGEKRSLSTPAKLESFVADEQRFLASILSLDTKNYHVWSYRQWLCSRFPSMLLPTYQTVELITFQSTTSVPAASAAPSISSTYISHSEVVENEKMIEDDIRNNSAWSHRYFLLFGQVELCYSTTHGLILKQVNTEQLVQKSGLLDMDLVLAEIEYTKNKIRLAPQNASPWNYLRGVLNHGGIAISTMRDFCEEHLGPNKDLWADQYSEVEIEQNGSTVKERRPTGVQSSHAVEWLGEIYSMKQEAAYDRSRSEECYRALADKWDPIRKRYWEWKVKEMEKE